MITVKELQKKIKTIRGLVFVAEYQAKEGTIFAIKDTLKAVQIMTNEIISKMEDNK